MLPSAYVLSPTQSDSETHAAHGLQVEHSWLGVPLGKLAPCALSTEGQQVKAGNRPPPSVLLALSL